MGLGYLTRLASEMPSSMPSAMHWKEAVTLVSVRKSARPTEEILPVEIGLLPL